MRVSVCSGVFGAAIITKSMPTVRAAAAKGAASMVGTSARSRLSTRRREHQQQKRSGPASDKKVGVSRIPTGTSDAAHESGDRAGSILVRTRRRAPVRRGLDHRAVRDGIAERDANLDHVGAALDQGVEQVEHWCPGPGPRASGTPRTRLRCARRTCHRTWPGIAAPAIKLPQRPCAWVSPCRRGPRG